MKCNYKFILIIILCVIVLTVSLTRRKSRDDEKFTKLKNTSPYDKPFI